MLMLIEMNRNQRDETSQLIQRYKYILLILVMEKIVNILLVDDDEIDCMNVKRAFKKSNISNPLSIAHNGVEALDMLKGTNGSQKISPLPRIILLDINMPKMNGLEV